MELYENKDKSIMCPVCNKFLLKTDKRDPRERRIKCRNCRIIICFTPKTDHFEVKKIPDTKSASGMRFY